MAVKSASLAELDLFSPPVVQTAVEREYNTDYRPITQLSDEAPVLFDITEQKHFIDLYNSQLYVKLKIVKKDGAAVTTAKKVIPVNNILHSLWEKITVTIEGKEVTTSNKAYPYKAMFSTLLSYQKDTKDSQLQAQGYFKDDSKDMDKITENVGGARRNKLFQKSNTVELQGPLYEDVFMQKRYLLNNTRLTIKLDRMPQEFILMNLETAVSYKLTLQDVVFKARMVDLDPSVQYSIARTLETQPALYPYTRREIRVENLPIGFTSGTLENIFPNQLPSRIITALVPAKAYNGDVKQNPFNFKPFDLNRISLTVNGTTIATYTPTFDDEGTGVAPSYLSLYEAFKELGNDFSNDINLSDYSRSYALYAFNIKPTFRSSTLPDQGHTRLSISFKTALTEAACLLIHAETPALMEISSTRNVILK